MRGLGRVRRASAPALAKVPTEIISVSRCVSACLRVDAHVRTRLCVCGRGHRTVWVSVRILYMLLRLSVYESECVHVHACFCVCKCVFLCMQVQADPGLVRGSDTDCSIPYYVPFTVNGLQASHLQYL